MDTAKGVLALLGTTVTLAMVYVIVTSPQTSAIVNSAGGAFSGILRAATGR